MATYTSIQTGNWEDDSTWSGSGTPSTNDKAIVVSGHVVDINTADKALTTLELLGQITFRDNTSLAVSGNATIGPAGRIRVVDGLNFTVSGTLYIMAGANINYAGLVVITVNHLIFQSSATYLLYRLSVWNITTMAPLHGVHLEASAAGWNVKWNLINTARAVGGSFCQIDCSGGARLVAYGTKDLGNNTNISFYTARGKRAVMTLNRRAYQTGLT